MWTTVCLRKGAWPYAVEGTAYMLQRLQVKDLKLRADPEPSMKTLFEAVAGRASQKGVLCKFEPTTAGSHQSIGGVEKLHDIQAGYVRTIYGMILERTGVKIHPRHRLFPWLIRYTMLVINCFHVRPNGMTVYRMMHGNMSKP